MSTLKRPLVGVIADRQKHGDHWYHQAGEKYLDALIRGAGVYPVVLPAITAEIDVNDIITEFDGLFLTGATSNVEPHRYFGPPSREGTEHDPDRDEKVLALIPAAIAAGMPLFAVCRGYQEMNVAFGGTLHQHVHEVEGYHDHRENPDAPLDIMYGPVHPVSFTPGGMLESAIGQSSVQVNSLHHQGVDRLADGLRVEAVADDGLIEAFVVEDAPGWTLAVQWHPEWKCTQNPVSMAIYQSFGDACRAFRDAHD
ncbi:MAG: gamma-glutamyl-gamma-aminobutyrate hydrolase family protein [Xanthomonadales bacterium]|nr:gamma-glutamyl-gamma-aminobutyrate hydrolase family protein [Xanthomonadales bacterium]